MKRLQLSRYSMRWCHRCKNRTLFEKKPKKQHSVCTYCNTTGYANKKRK